MGVFATAAIVACTPETVEETPSLEVDKESVSLTAKFTVTAGELTKTVAVTQAAAEAQKPEPEPESAVTETIWEGEAYDLGTSWSGGLQINSVPILSEDAKIHVVYEAPAGFDYYQLKFCYIGQDWEWVQLTSPTGMNSDGCVTLDSNKTEYVLALNDEDIAAINAGKGMVIQGYGAVITKVSYK